MLSDKPNLNTRIKARLVHGTGLATLSIIFFCLAALLYDVFSSGLSHLDWNFLSGYPSRFAEKAGIYPALIGTLWLVSLTALISIPLGVFTAIYLEEFAPKGRFTTFLQTNIANLAGVPSIVYGILGLALFVRWMALEQSLLSGALTMALLVMPIITITSSEALRSVSDLLRQAAYGVGATKTQVVVHHVLPEAIPGILTGVILAISRAIGETAPIIMIGAVVYTTYLPEGPLDSFTALPLQIFNWAGRPQPEFHILSAAAIIILLAVTLGLNTLSIYIRHVINKKKGRA